MVSPVPVLNSYLAITNWSMRLPPEATVPSYKPSERLTLSAGSTGVGHGVAVPHARLEGLSRMRGIFVRLDQRVDFDAVDGAAPIPS